MSHASSSGVASFQEAPQGHARKTLYRGCSWSRAACPYPQTLGSEHRRPRVHAATFWGCLVAIASAMKTTSIAFSTTQHCRLQVGRSVRAKLRLAGAILWYNHVLISQDQGAEIGGLARADFLDALGRANIMRHPDDGRGAQGRASTATPCVSFTHRR